MLRWFLSFVLLLLLLSYLPRYAERWWTNLVLASLRRGAARRMNVPCPHLFFRRCRRRRRRRSLQTTRKTPPPSRWMPATGPAETYSASSGRPQRQSSSSSSSSSTATKTAKNVTQKAVSDEAAEPKHKNQYKTANKASVYRHQRNRRRWRCPTLSDAVEIVCDGRKSVATTDGLPFPSAGGAPECCSGGGKEGRDEGCEVDAKEGDCR